MKTILFLISLLMMLACKNTSKKEKSVEDITSSSEQNSLFKSLIKITDNGNIPQSLLKDSLAFLILPVQASCPSCRKKTIDSIYKHKNTLPSNHFIILSAKGGKKIISSYFREQNLDLPNIGTQLILDTINLASQFELYKNNTAIYYSLNSKVYKKVMAIPATVKQDLQEFFTGYRIDEPLH